MDQYTIWNQAVAIIALLVVILGTICNALTLLVSTRKELRSIPTFIFIAFNSFIETIPLYNRNLDIFVSVYFLTFIRFLNDTTCKMHLFLHFWPLQSSAWLLVAMSVEIFLSIKIPTWRKRLFSAKKAIIASLIIIGLFFIVNFCLNFSPYRGSFKIGNRTLYDNYCYEGFLGEKWSTYNLYMYSLLPFGVLFVVNTLLVYEIAFKKRKSIIDRSDKDKAKRRNLSISVMILTMKYILLTGPSAIFAGFFYSYIILIPYAIPMVSTFSTLRFINHSFSFVILLATNRKFFNEFKKMISFEKLESSEKSKAYSTRVEN